MDHGFRARYGHSRLRLRTAMVDHGHTVRWTVPEILNEEGIYSKEADIFSFAMVMIKVRGTGGSPAPCVC